MKILADAVDTIFGGGITPPPAMNIGGGGTAQEGLGKFISFGIEMFILVAGFFLIMYMLWGAFDWINSGGEKEKLIKAQNKITNALIGIILVFVVLSVFTLVAGDLLGIVKRNSSGGFDILLPSLK